MRMRPPGDHIDGRPRAFERDQLLLGTERALDRIEQLDHRVVADEVRVLRLVEGQVGHVHEVVVVRVAGDDGAHAGDVLAHQRVDALVVGVDLAERDLADGGVRVEGSRHDGRALPPDDQAAHAEEGDLHRVLVRGRLRDEGQARLGRARRRAGGEQRGPRRPAAAARPTLQVKATGHRRRDVRLRPMDLPGDAPVRS